MADGFALRTLDLNRFLETQNMTMKNTAAADPLPVLYTIPDLCRSLRLSEVTIRRMIWRGALRPVRIGGSIRFTQDQVDDLMRSGVPAAEA